MKGQRSAGWIALAIGLASVVLIVGAILELRGSRHQESLVRALESYASGHWSDALDEARTRLAQDPQDRQALRLMARASGRLERDSATESLYARLGVDGAEAEDFLLLGSALLRQGKAGPGLRMLERARAVSPDDNEVLKALGKAYHRLGFPIAALRSFQQLATFDGADVKDRWLLGLLLLELDQPLGAAEALNDVLQHDPTGQAVGEPPATIRKQLAHAWLRSGRPVEAGKALEPLLAGEPEPEVFWLQSRVCLQQDDLRGAVAALSQAPDYRKQDWTRVDPAPRVGTAGCARCHQRNKRHQESSHHAHTLLWGSATGELPLPRGVVRDPGDARVEHRLKGEPETVRVETTRDDRRFAAVITYIIGSGNRGQTPIVRDDQGTFREFRLTRYATPVGWDVTIHHPAAPETEFSALGKALSEDQVRDCLNCHSTNPDAVLEGRSGGALRGIDCERCHGPGGNHIRAVKLGLADMAIGQPRLATADQRAALCAQCHRAPQGFPEDAPDFIRFQSPNLSRSRCFVESGGALDCTSCHNPHRDAVTEPASYEAICLNCHGRNDKSSTAEARSNQHGRSISAKPCPVDAAKRCLPCHMPRIPNVIPHSTYTDHFIRVRRD